MTNLFFIQFYLFSALMLIMMIITMINFHPIIMMIILICWNILLILNMSLYKSMFIYPIMFFMVMISGLMISLMYFTSMISNEKSFMSYSPNSHKWLIALFIILMTLTIMTSKSLCQFSSSLSNIDHFAMFDSMNPPKLNFNFMYFHPLNNLTTMSMLYLLIALVTIVKICSPKNMTMRKLS